MKRSFTLRSVIGICLISLIISCHKRGEFEVPCKIVRISHIDRTGSGAPYATYNGYFEYTNWGDPAKITWDLATTGRPNYIFKYDKKRRLTDLVGSHGTNFEFYTKYIWSGDRIVSDTTFISGSDVNDPHSADQGYQVATYTYDFKGRIIQIDFKHLFGGSFTRTYAYDAAGNKIRNDGNVYDDKKHYLRTNLILMFINRDYSVNNYKVADTYSKKGLPTAYNSTVLTFMNSFINEIDYSCDHKNH